MLAWSNNPFGKFTFIKEDIADKSVITQTFEAYKPNIVINFADQAEVRYSIDNLDAYTQSNVIGFYNILESRRLFRVIVDGDNVI